MAAMVAGDKHSPFAAAGAARTLGGEAAVAFGGAAMGAASCLVGVGCGTGATEDRGFKSLILQNAGLEPN